MAKKMVPKGAWVVGRCKPKETLSTGGLVIPASSDSQDEVVVLAVGPDVKRAKVGDVVVFTVGRTTAKTGEELYLIEDEHIIAALVTE